MTNDTSLKLRDAFLELPDKIRDHLTSEKTIDRIIKINENRDFIGEDIRIIPQLITRLVIDDLKPGEFIDELHKELSLELNEARGITKEIEELILRPIEIDLKTLGVDIVVILSPTDSSKEEKLESTTEESEKEKTLEPDEVKKSSTEETEAKHEDQPFILHEEKPLFETAAPQEKPSFTFEPKKSDKPKHSSSAHAISVRIEGPKKEQRENPKVVHYSNLSTKLNADTDTDV